VLVLVLDTYWLKSFEDEDEHEDEDETANELIETALILRSFFPFRPAVFYPACDELSRIEAAADTRHPKPLSE